MIVIRLSTPCEKYSFAPDIRVTFKGLWFSVALGVVSRSTDRKQDLSLPEPRGVSQEKNPLARRLFRVTFHRQIYPGPGWEEVRGVPLPSAQRCGNFLLALLGLALAAPG